MPRSPPRAVDLAWDLDVGLLGLVWLSRDPGVVCSCVESVGGLESTDQLFEKVRRPWSLTRHMAWEIRPDEKPDDRARQLTLREDSFDSGTILVSVGALAAAAEIADACRCCRPLLLPPPLLGR